MAERDHSLELKAANARLERERHTLRRELAVLQESVERAGERISSLEEMLAWWQAEFQESREALDRHSREACQLRERERKLYRLAAEVGRRASRSETKAYLLLKGMFWLCTFQLFARMNAERDITRRMKVALESELFDANWYVETYPDVLIEGVDPLRHFCEYGFLEKRLPGPGATEALLEELVCALK